jgi:hypothetical protein
MGGAITWLVDIQTKPVEITRMSIPMSLILILEPSGFGCTGVSISIREFSSLQKFVPDGYSLAGPHF